MAYADHHNEARDEIMPAVTRIGDADVTHCSGMTRAVGSGYVFANGIGVSRSGDAASCGHTISGSSNVFAG